MPRPTVDPFSLDFATLRTLCLVEDSGSFTAAAQALGVNQSAVSYTIERLRGAFHDPLFVREKGRQIATARCQQIMAEVRPMLSSIARLARPEDFDPGQARQGFTLACNFYERLLIVPLLVRALRAQAPGIALNVVNSRGRGPERLLHGSADLLIGPHPVEETGIYVSRLWPEDYVCLMDPAHPAAEGPLDLACYLTLDLIEITYEGNWTSPYLLELRENGHHPAPALMVPSPAGIARLVAGSTLVATLPRRLAHEIGEGLRIVDCPVSGRFDVSLIWPPRLHADAMHRWMRGLITGLRRDVARA